MGTTAPPRGRTVAGLTLALFLLALWCPLPAQAATISVSPTRGPAGSSVAVSGTDFESGTVTILLDGVLVMGSATADEDGSFATSATVPVLALTGPHTIVATQVLGPTASTSFVITGQSNTTTTTTTPTTSTTTPTSTSTTTTSTTTPTSSTTTSTTSTSTTTTVAPTTATIDPDTVGAPTTTAPTTTTTAAVPVAPSTTSPDSDGPTTTDTETSTGPTDTTEADDSTSTTTTPDDTSGGIPAVLTAPVLLPFTDGDEPPDLAGVSTQAGTFSVAPGAGPPGTTLTVTVAMDEAISGLTTVEIHLAGRKLGDTVTLDDTSVTVERTVPDLEPGTYELDLRSDDAVLASTDFTITSTEGGIASEDSPIPWVPVVALTVGGILLLGRVLLRFRDPRLAGAPVTGGVWGRRWKRWDPRVGRTLDGP